MKVMGWNKVLFYQQHQAVVFSLVLCFKLLTAFKRKPQPEGIGTEFFLFLRKEQPSEEKNSEHEAGEMKSGSETPRTPKRAYNKGVF